MIFDAEKGLLVENKGLLTKKSSYSTAYRIFIRNWNFLVGHSSFLITGVFSKIMELIDMKMQVFGQNITFYFKIAAFESKSQKIKKRI